jgi:hypothetical protein
VLVRERVQRFQRARELGQLEVGDLERQAPGPADRRALEALVVLGLDDQQDPSASRSATQLSSAAVASMMARLPTPVAHTKRA